MNSKSPTAVSAFAAHQYDCDDRTNQPKVADAMIQLGKICKVRSVDYSNAKLLVNIFVAIVQVCHICILTSGDESDWEEDDCHQRESPHGLVGVVGNEIEDLLVHGCSES